MIKRGEHPFHFNNIEYVQENERSSLISANAGGVIKKDRRYKLQTKVIIAGSGMCTGGRILYHLKKNITAQRNTIIFVGYLAQGTLGWEISDGAKSIYVDNKFYRVRARHYKFSGFSDHGDRDDLLLFLSKLNSVPKGIFCIHSEINASSDLKNEIIKRFDTSVNIPSIGDVFILK
jgi:metallo-beta-lactamase family protein